MSSSSRLELAIDAGFVALPENGLIAVYRPASDVNLSMFETARLTVLQPFKPDYDRLLSRGFQCTTNLTGEFAAAIIFVPRAKQLANSYVEDAARRCHGPIILDGPKTSGVESLIKAIKKSGAELGDVFSKAHGKVVQVKRLRQNSVDTEQTTIDGVYRTAPGVFSADAIDKASLILADAYAGKLQGKVADLGAGWGYLADRALCSGAVDSCHLVEADHDALDCAKLNVQDQRAVFHWCDATQFSTDIQFDHIVTNPPFHTTRAADPGLGKAFIRQSAGLLKRSGTLWLVANRHLPYEQELRMYFGSVSEIAANGGFKVFRADKPKSASHRKMS